MLIVLESSTFNSLAVRPSPLSFANQHLHGKMYLIPLVGTATDSSSTNQQLSGVTPLWPSWAEEETETEGEEESIHPLICFWSTHQTLRLQLIMSELQWRHLKQCIRGSSREEKQFYRFSYRHSSRFSLPPSWSLPRPFHSTQSAPCRRRWRISFLLAGPATDGLSRLRWVPWWWHTPWL